MSVRHRELLKDIRTFPSLIKYLRDELDWPIHTQDFEELTFDYTAEELGIDGKSAAKIQEIKRLRPLSPNQPWGIFFVKFEPKRLPVVALRRILSRVVVKKRASANSAERAAWEAEDLLFVSNYGEGEERKISLAHFTQDRTKNDLPTLKVLGWDNLDTALHLDHVAEELHEKLAWPEDENDIEVWRKTWRSAFTLRHREVITTSKVLAIKLAELARDIRTRIKTVLIIETENGPVRNLLKTFQEILIHDLDEDGFADMYAQTIAYGLLSAQICNPKGDTVAYFKEQFEVTNPFLKELMETFISVGNQNDENRTNVNINFDEFGISEITDLLQDANMNAVVRDFGDRNPMEDPVIHFYELFLKEYDPKKRMQRGIFYTPRPVVSFIVRSIDELLRTEFGLEDGLADTTTWKEMAERGMKFEIPEDIKLEDPFVQILDPATGTGTFLVEVISLIYKTMAEKWKIHGYDSKMIEQLWNDYVPNQLLPRLHGYELLMAPYTIAHLKIGLKLYETGYRFESNQRVNVFLTNSLEQPLTSSETLFPTLDALAIESAAAKDAKQHSSYTVVLGNPPYSNLSANLSDEARKLVARYKQIDGKPLVERNALQLERNVNDDYVKFWAIAEDLMAAPAGVVGYITNSSFYDATTLRGLRARLLQMFTSARLVDLGGSTDLSGRSMAGVVDENVFDISQGVAITILSRKYQPNERLEFVRSARLLGERSVKYKVLTETTCMNLANEKICVRPPEFVFVALPNDEEWEIGMSIEKCMSIYAEGLKTGFDEGLVGYTESELREKIRRLAEVQTDELREQYSIGEKGWADKLLQQRASTRGASLEALDKKPIRFQYRPLDYRFLFWPSKLLKAPSIVTGKHLMVPNNLCLMVARQVSGPENVSHFLVCRQIPECRIFYTKKGTASYFPLRLDSGVTNFTESFRQWFCKALNVDWDDMDVNQNPHSVSSRQVFNCLYAEFHSHEYRKRFAQQLKRNWPRVFTPSNRRLFIELQNLGAELEALHLMESPKLDHYITTLKGLGEFQVEKVSYSNKTAWLDKEKTCGFQGIPEKVWNFQIGGYQVCEKWLKNRGPKKGNPGRTLDQENITHFQKIVVALNETIRIIKEIDEVIDKHGGWPDAFTIKDD